MSADVVTIRLRLEHWGKVDARPDLFARQLSPLLDAVHRDVETVAADQAHAEEVVAGTKPAEWEVALCWASG